MGAGRGQNSQLHLVQIRGQSCSTHWEQVPHHLGPSVPLGNGKELTRRRKMAQDTRSALSVEWPLGLGTGAQSGAGGVSDTAMLLPRPRAAAQRHDRETPPRGGLPLCEDEFGGLRRPPEVLRHQLLHSLW